MNLFAILREHANTKAETIASLSSRRTVTYRKLWSRVERATARMKDEWQVKSGDTVVYWGCGHQDALMFYLATARCGAKLLPLEHTSLQHRAADILRDMPAALLLHDDDIVFETSPAAAHIANLSALIATRCHYTPAVDEDEMSASLFTATFTGTLTTMPAADGVIAYQKQSLHQLSSVAQRLVDRDKEKSFVLGAALFDADIFAPKVLSQLIAGGMLQFR